MTDEDKAGWAREEAARIAATLPGDFAEQPKWTALRRKESADKIESALLAAERRAKEECARIADREADEYIAGSNPETWTFEKSRRAAFEMRSMGEAIKMVAAAIRATLPKEK